MQQASSGQLAVVEPASTNPATNALRFSRHALSRMASRGIELTTGQWTRLGEAVQSLRAKGGRHSLILLDHTALVVSLKNSLVITVVDRQAMQENIFTNIDSAMLA